MKELIFKSGKTIRFAECYGRQEFVQGVRRDTLDFRFDVNTNTLSEVDGLFTSDECSELTIRETKMVAVPVKDETGAIEADENGNPIMEEVEQTSDYVYSNYSIRASISKQFFTLATANGVEDVEQISVKIGKLTNTELQLISYLPAGM